MKRRFRAFNFLATGVLLFSGLATVIAPTAASAATANSLYTFDLRNLNQPLANNIAAANTGAQLSLNGDVGFGVDGTHFDGDKVSQSSSGSYKPKTGNVLNVPSTSAMAFGLEFNYTPPSDGTNCFASDTPNLTQIGTYVANQTQAKLQLSKCIDTPNRVSVMCRFAGVNTPTSVTPVQSSLALQENHNYRAICEKTPDSGGNTTITLMVTDLDAPGGPQTTTDTFTQGALGNMVSTQQILVANAAKAPQGANNTDQFHGLIMKLSYCAATTIAAANTCVMTELPGLATAVLSYTNNVTRVQPNQAVNYTATITNTGGETIQSPRLSVHVPYNTTFNAASYNEIPDANGNVNWSPAEIGPIAPGQSYSLAMTVIGSSTIAPGQAVESDATMSTTTGYDVICNEIGSVCSTFDLDYNSAAPSVNMTLDDGVTQMQDGQTDIYTINVVNYSGTTIADPVVTLNMPLYTTFVNSSWDVRPFNGTLTWNFDDLGLSLPAGESVTLQLVVEGQFVPNAPINTTATFTTSDGICGNTGSVCSANDNDTGVSPGTPTGTVTYSDGATQLQPNQNTTYTATFTNTSATTSIAPTIKLTIPNDTTLVSSDYGATNDGNGNLTWNTANVGSVGAGNHVTRSFTVKGNAGIVNNEQISSTATVTTTDNTCTNSGSACSASDTDTGLVTPTLTQYVTNQSVETNITGWTQTYNGQSTVTQASGDGEDGTHSVQAARTTSTGPAGFVATPRLVTNIVAGKVYTGSVWVKAQTAGTQINLVLKEVNSGGTAISTKTVSVTPSDTAWHQISVDETGVTAGDQLIYNVYATSLPVGGYFRADMLSLTSPN